MDMKITIVAILLSVVLILSIVQTLQLNGMKSKISAASATGAVTAKTGAGAIDMTGWTENEKMNYEMHGTIPARFGGSSSSGSSGVGMVGGC